MVSADAVDTLILCGGLGTRLRTAVGDRPKGLAEVGGRPFLDLLVDELKRAGLRRFILCTGYGADQIAAHFRGRTDAEFDFSVETQPLGTGGAVLQALAKVRSDPFFVVNGDSFCAVDYAQLVAAHADCAAAATIVATPPDARDDTGTMVVDGDGRIGAFAEKSAGAGGGMRYVNAGIYVLQREALPSGMPPTPYSLERELFPGLVAQGRCFAFLVRGPLVDIGTPDRLAAAQALLRPASISVVIPCYRCAATLAEALRSVNAQTLRPAEVVAVDDASDDATPQVLAELQREYGKDWLRVIRFERNRGPADARNAGWDAAHGEFVAFLDADDTWHPRKLELQHRFMRAHPEARVTGHRELVAPRGGPPADIGGEPAVRYPSSLEFLLTNPFVTPSVMLRRDLAHRFRAGRRHMEDYLLWQTMALSDERIALLEAPLVTIHKAAFGAGGQSAQLRAMGKADLCNYWVLRAEGRIGLAAALALSAYSLAKHLRRLLIMALRALRA